MFEQLRQKFLASFATKIDDLKLALENQNTQALTVLVHQLTGSSGSYGFDQIAKLCSEIEEEALTSNIINQPIIDKTNHLIQMMKKQAES